MSRVQRGFGLLETVLALALGALLLTAASQVFVSAYRAWQLQEAAARLSDDARWVLQRMARDIRMTGAFNCLRPEAMVFEAPASAAAFSRPVQIVRAADGTLASLGLMTADVPGLPGSAEWTVLTDCRQWARVVAGTRTGEAGAMAFGVRRQVYQMRGTTLRLSSGGSTQPLLDHVQAFHADTVHHAGTLRLDLRLTLFDPAVQVRQQHALSVTLRHPVPKP
ncbi:prepilin-type N-terminal cleavage/methylation domain-containing protein [Pseudomonas entomophila]|jgi:type IV pilus assembly protein PilW|uniref:PilW family protein n=1 Tax=Pseudomonas entomophila TaxID=312306 RepID=UPI0015E40C6F|nr:prepilin-type N-terminal cleavage/methylation domain-containing protein [Pseudomonas entomophila]MBA1193911.1 prepilin-type N-terminal cleavage/methylation domain-containing protein [Pseudomonas entomophila]